MEESEVLTITFISLMLGGVAVLLMAMYNRRRFREMEHRERLAMIDRGLMPSPEQNPEAFERQVGFSSPPSQTAIRLRSAGVMMIGLGLALALLISMTAENPQIGVGVGGAFALLGGAFFVNAALSMRDQPPAARSRNASRPPVPRAGEPPTTPPGGFTS